MVTGPTALKLDGEPTFEEPLPMFKVEYENMLYKSVWVRCEKCRHMTRVNIPK